MYFRCNKICIAISPRQEYETNLCTVTRRAEFSFDPEGKSTWEIRIPVMVIVLIPRNNPIFIKYINLGFILNFVLNKILVKVLTHDLFSRIWVIKRTKIESPANSWMTSPVPKAFSKSKNTAIVTKSRVTFIKVLLFILSAPLYVKGSFILICSPNIYR